MIEPKQKITIEESDTDPCIMTYGDVIRHMDNQELAVFLTQIHANIQLGTLAVMRAKSSLHRNVDPAIEKPNWTPMYNFMQERIDDEDADFADVWGIDNWQNLMRWVIKGTKNFGMNIVY